MCAYCQQNEIAALYNEVMVSDDYCEIVKLFAERLSEQAEKTRAEVLKPKFQGIDVTPLLHVLLYLAALKRKKVLRQLLLS